MKRVVVNYSVAGAARDCQMSIPDRPGEASGVVSVDGQGELRFSISVRVEDVEDTEDSAE